jgi:hypothetical protein
MLTHLKNWLGMGGKRDRKTGATGPDHPPGANRQALSATRRAIESGTGAARRGADHRDKQGSGATDRVEVLQIAEEPDSKSGNSDGFDPYNTGSFDRSRSWERRFRD